MAMIFNGRYDYKGFGECESHCWLQIFAERDREGERLGEVVVIATEMPTNEGTSITNIVESLATQTWEKVGRPDAFVWFEHYPPDDDFGESWSLVAFGGAFGEFRKPNWLPATQQQVEVLIRQPIPAREEVL